MSEPSAGTAAQTIPLNCLEGLPAPPVVIEGWRQLMTFPRPAWEPYWRLLAALLVQPGNATHQTAIAQMCKAHAIAPESMLAALGCGELLLGRAAAANLGQTQFQQDLDRLGGEGDGDLARLFGERYPELKRIVRRQILMDALATHGKVMTGLSWRLDKVEHASQGNHLNTQIVLLTLDYREGRNQGSVTLQLTRDAARMLRRFCDRLDDPAAG